MTLNANLELSEGRRRTVYKDSLGNETIGVGCRLPLSDAEIDWLRDHRVAIARADLDQNAPWWLGMSECRRDALLEMSFNLGWPKLAEFKKMLGFLKAGDFQFAADEALASTWAGQVGDRAKRIAQAFREG